MPPKSKAPLTPVPPAAPPRAAQPHDGPWRAGTSYLVRTVTVYVVGRLVGVYPDELVFADAAWVADTGRLSDALRSGKLNEVEPFPLPVILGRGSVCDATEWPHSLPLTQK